MAKFGLFKMGFKGAMNEYEGDFMEMDKEFVKIKKFGTVENSSGELVAAIRLEKGFDVRKMSD